MLGHFPGVVTDTIFELLEVHRRSRTNGLEAPTRLSGRSWYHELRYITVDTPRWFNPRQDPAVQLRRHTPGMAFSLIS